MMESYKKIFPFIKPYKTNAVLNVVFNILYALFSSLSMVSLFPMLNILFGKQQPVTVKPVLGSVSDLGGFLKDSLAYYAGRFAGEDPSKALLFVIALIISLFFLKNLFNYFAMVQITTLRNGVLKDMRIKLYQKIVELPVSYYSEKRKGDVMARMLGDVAEVQNSFFSIFELVIREPLTIIFTIITMFYISVNLTLFVFIFIPVTGLIISRIGKSLKGKSQRAQQEAGYFISLVEETLSGLKVVKSYNAEKHFRDKFSQSIGRLQKLANSIGNKNNLASPLSEFLGIVTIAILLLYGGQMVLVSKTLEGAAFITYMALAYNILTPAKAISKASYSVKSGLAAADRVFAVLEENNEITNKPDAIVKGDFNDSIILKNVQFKYDEEPVLKDFSLEIKKGQTVALVGQSGSGKSTIANLLTRFYDVNSGSIAIDGINLKDMELHSLRHLLGLVTQDSVLFNDTIKANIALGKNNATDEEIIEALKIANAYEFVKDLPQGIHTNIGDSGNKLSGGQKQRLSIARAVLKNPPIMILDEATSALDTESEKLVQVALENMMQNRTSIVIAHRLSTIQKADIIVVMQKGVIVEQGNHEQLMAHNGTYKKLVTMQSFEN
ncbi:ABC transporter ATP-binding protein [Flavobacterium sp. CYK-4]|uniref:ABC transporter ATP-binding protein n=1 Tax=Flavobacterium lotistagni TaxID=2709660 RepID=UPI00140A4421|nr:ABC transporter ATP-binding protein [Flavobacterium lotistagni]